MKTLRLAAFIIIVGRAVFSKLWKFCLNQVQEHKIDRIMIRTALRPVAANKVKPAAALVWLAVFDVWF